MLPRAATDFYALQQRVNAVAVNEVRRIWRRMGDDFDSSWKRHGPAILDVLVEAQRQVTDEAQTYVPKVLAESDLPDQPVGEGVPERLVGVASDGRPLDTLAYGAVTNAKTAIGNGATTASALNQGGGFLELVAKLQTADAARQAVGVLTAGRKNLGGTVRVLNPPSCQRCAILAGRFYRWSQGFDRHPRCDCTNVPAKSVGWAESEGFLTDPMDAYRKGEIKDLTPAQIKALSEGADINQVVNAYRGISTTATEQGMSARRIHMAEKARSAAELQRQAVAAGSPDLLGFLPSEVRNRGPIQALPTPEGIYLQAAGDRDEAIRLLRKFGFLT